MAALARQGYTAVARAEQLGIAPTVKKHLERGKEKMRVRRKDELIRALSAYDADRGG